MRFNCGLVHGKIVALMSDAGAIYVTKLLRYFTWSWRYFSGPWRHVTGPQIFYKSAETFYQSVVHCFQLRNNDLEIEVYPGSTLLLTVHPCWLSNNNHHGFNIRLWLHDCTTSKGAPKLENVALLGASWPACSTVCFFFAAK